MTLASFSGLIPEVILLATAALILLLERPLRDVKMDVGATLASIGMLGAAFFAIRGPQPGAAFGGAIACDSFTSYFKLAAVATGLLSVGLNTAFQRAINYRRPDLFAVILLALVGICLAAAARDLIVLFLAIEVLAISTATMLGFYIPNEKARESLMKTFLLGILATALLLLGITFLFGATGATRYTEIAAVLETLGSGHPMVILGLFLILAGIGFRLTVFPFSTFTADALQGSPGPSAGFASTALVLGGSGAILRLFTELDVASVGVQWTPILGTIAGLSILLGHIVAVYQDSVRRMLGYSTIAHAGTIFMGIALAQSPTLAPGAREAVLSATLFYLFGFVFLQIGAYAMVSAILYGRRFSEYLPEFRGLGRREPMLGIAYTIVLLSLAGVPPTFGFLGKLHLLTAAFQADLMPLALAAIVGSLISVFYYGRVIVVMYFREDPHAPPMVSSVPLKAAIAAASFGALGLGLLPAKVLETAVASIHALF